jgi:crotonobetainyl-CoA:carnitine CoA-transferase CaiB-like acyl-CoA transferase
MHTTDEWRATAEGTVASNEPLVRVTTHAAAPRLLAPAAPPYAGVRVLDLTRVIAGPVCTRLLAAWGADVLRIDPPGFQEVTALLPETTAGKRCASLDLTSAESRAVFEDLAALADVLVTGLRPGALGALGLDAAALQARHPHLIIAELDAYGWDGPWQRRRGFDSLVQMSTGIAAAGARALGRSAPAPLPAQALDHGTGHLLAAAVGRALTRRMIDGSVSHVRASLVGTANLLLGSADPARLTVPPPSWTDDDTVATNTQWGPARRVPVGGRISGTTAGWSIPAGPLGRHAATWDA